MSYSFHIQANSKADAIQQVSEALDNVVVDQPVHSSDKAQALAAATLFIGLLAGDPGEGEMLTVNVSGSLGWRDEGVFTSANFSIQSWIGPRL